MMAENSKIEWTDHTFNPWIGCQKVSDGCKFCYAERDFTRKPRWANTWGPAETSERIRTSEANWRKPFKWQKQAEAEGKPTKVFCASLADVFEDNSQVALWRIELFEEIIQNTPWLQWLILTKRPGRAKEFFDNRPELLTGNVWLGVSIENQQTADERIPLLLRTPAAVRFVSCEPLIGLVEIHRYALGGLITTDPIDWVIAGGESGHRARPMHPDWARSLRDQATAAGVPFFFKQFGEYKEIQFDKRGRGDILFSPINGIIDRLPDPFNDNTEEFKRTVAMRRVGKKAAGRILDGREWSQMPAEYAGAPVLAG